VPAAPAAAQCVHPTGLGGCFTTVQEAVDAASPGDIIAINAGIYPGVVVVDRSLTLSGVDRDLAILDGGATGSVVTTEPGAEVTLTHLTIRNGSGTPGPSGARGGGIFGAGRLTLDDVAVRDNSAPCGASCSFGGGGIFFADTKGRLTLLRSSVLDNSSVFGGWIHVLAGRVRIVDSTISGNSNGGISDVNAIRRVSLEITGSTLSGNSGARPALETHGRTAITNSTISDNVNTSSECVAGISAASAQSRVTILSSTVAGNVSPSSCSSIGVGISAWLVEVRITSSIVAYNQDAFGGSDCAGTLRSSGGNLLLSQNGCTLVAVKRNDRTGLDPKLGPLQDNGGPTHTRALLPLSGALDLATRCPRADQRGQPRERPCDAGAYEMLTQ
jgi:hypothetical protein